MTILSRYAISLIVGVSSLGLAWWGWTSYYVSKGVIKERARVEAAGKKLNAKALKARERAVSDPDRVLSKFYRD